MSQVPQGGGWGGGAPVRIAVAAGPRDFAAIEAEARSFLWKVHGWMALGLGLTGLLALGLALLSIGGSTATGLYLTPLGEVVTSPIVRFGSMGLALLLVFGMAGLAPRLSTGAAAALFLAYAALNGVWLSVLFLVYTAESVGATFLVTAGMFAATSAFGYATKRDLSGVGSFAFMGLVGLVLASIVNFFLASPMLYWLITYAGVAVFVGLTAWDTQKLRQIGGMAMDGETRGRAAVHGALTLYLDFLNLFLFLLRLLGRRR